MRQGFDSLQEDKVAAAAAAATGSFVVVYVTVYSVQTKLRSTKLLISAAYCSISIV